MKIFTWRQRGIVMAVNLISLGLFVGAGYGLDRWLNRWPLFSVIGLALSFVIGQFALAKILMADYHRGPKE